MRRRLLVLCGTSLLLGGACGEDTDSSGQQSSPNSQTAGGGGAKAGLGLAGSLAPIVRAGSSATAGAGTGASTVKAGSGAAGSSAPVAGSSAAGGIGAAGVGAAGNANAAAGSGGEPGANAGNAAAGAGQAAAAGSGGAAGSNAMLPPPPVPAPLQWTRCGSNECSTLKVPLDYAAPTGETIDIAVTRRKATGQQRIGSLLINPGGPGGSAVDFLDDFITYLGGPLNQRFDIVAFDPRGVGHSTPLDCHSTLEALIRTDPTPDSDAEWTETDQAATTFAAECGQKHAKLLPHLATPNVARDMDQVRAALGEEQLNYLGFSYGTSIGAFYAELFPKRIRAAVLDGAVDLELSALDISLQQAVGFENSLASYFEWCGLSANNCTWASARNSKPADEFARLSASVDATALTTTGGRSVGPGEFIIGVLAPLYSGEAGYRTISSALRSAESGDGTGLLASADSYLDRRPDGTYGNLQEANAAVNCLDTPAPEASQLRTEAMRFMQASSTFGLATLTGLYVCAHWPVKNTPPPRPKGAGAPPILVVGTTGDPATPYTWAQALASELESGVLLTHDGEGHTAYGRGDSCIDNAVEAYFFEQKVPAENMRCGPSNAGSPMPFWPSLYRFRMR